jgi:hypothetical protein
MSLSFGDEFPHQLEIEEVGDHCVCFVRKDLRFTRNGMAEVTLQIPWQYHNYAVYLLQKTTQPIRLELKPCRPTLKSL